MNCNDTQDQLHDYLDGDLSLHAQAEMEAHIVDCQDCRAAVSKEQSLRRLLSELPILPAREGFIESALQAAQQEAVAPVQVGNGQQRRGFFLGFGSAAVAGLALWLIVGLLPVEKAVEQEGFKPIQIALHETHDLKLAFYSKQARKGAMISIHLPSNVELAGFPDKRKLVWKANLTEGDNLLTLPIKALKVSSGELIAKIEYGKQAKTLKVRLHTTKPGMTQLNANSVALS